MFSHTEFANSLSGSLCCLFSELMIPFVSRTLFKFFIICIFFDCRERGWERERGRDREKERERERGKH